MWLNHGWTMAKSCRSACMWAGQRVLCLLQNLFKQSKLSLTLTLARAKCWGSCSDYNWDPWAPHIALHASWNVPRHLKRLETVQAIEHSVVVNGCKNSGTATIDHKLQRCFYQEEYEFAVHSLWHAVEVLPQPSYVTSLCKSAIAYFQSCYHVWRYSIKLGLAV